MNLAELSLFCTNFKCCLRACSSASIVRFGAIPAIESVTWCNGHKRSQYAHGSVTVATNIIETDCTKAFTISDMTALLAAIFVLPQCNLAWHPPSWKWMLPSNSLGIKQWNMLYSVAELKTERKKVWMDADTDGFEWVQLSSFSVRFFTSNDILIVLIFLEGISCKYYMLKMVLSSFMLFLMMQRIKVKKMSIILCNCSSEAFYLGFLSWNTWIYSTLKVFLVTEAASCYFLDIHPCIALWDLVLSSCMLANFQCVLVLLSVISDERCCSLIDNLN